nr:uncharacterized protein LOC109163885 isoform X1 [Ipomoea batatas]GME15274.1 uncharacterized protein LOC109163885 isoform X1 [Ipomoea batatas]
MCHSSISCGVFTLQCSRIQACHLCLHPRLLLNEGATTTLVFAELNNLADVIASHQLVSPILIIIN